MATSRDADGEGNTRYGLPVLDAEDFDLAEDEANALAEEGNGSGDEESTLTLRRVATSQLSRGAADNPCVMDVNGVEGPNRQIVGLRKHAVVFCSASWCRNCRSLKPKYTEIAREAGDDSTCTYFLRFPSPEYVNVVKRLCRKLLCMCR